MGVMLLKAIGIWVLFGGTAIVNGTAREKLLTPLLGQQLSLPLSGIVLSILIFLITLLLVSFLRVSASSTQGKKVPPFTRTHFKLSPPG